MYEWQFAGEHSPVKSSASDRGQDVRARPQAVVAAASQLPDGFASAGRRIAALPPASFFVVSAILHFRRWVQSSSSAL
jgi:hypothetical protein